MARPAAHDPITTKVTFAREIRAILSARCVTCHAPHGSAPMPLTTYDEVRPWARAIKEQVLDRRMPKWHAARGFGAFTNDPTLTPLESALVAAWVDGGLPRGGATGTEITAPPDVTSAAFRRESDRVLTLPLDVAGLSAPARVQWIAGWSFEPGDPRITSATLTSAAGGIGTWVAGDPPVVLPAGSALRVSGALQINLHRRPAADFEAEPALQPSVLRLRVAGPPARTVWQEEVGCNTPRQPVEAVEAPVTVLAVQAWRPPSCLRFVVGSGAISAIVASRSVCTRFLAKRLDSIGSIIIQPSPMALSWSARTSAGMSSRTVPWAWPSARISVCTAR